MFVQVKMERGLTLDEAFDETIIEQGEAWEKIKKAILGRWNDEKTRKI